MRKKVKIRRVSGSAKAITLEKGARRMRVLDDPPACPHGVTTGPCMRCTESGETNLRSRFWNTPKMIQVAESGRANERQVDGTHYVKYGELQPWDMWIPWNLNGFQCEVLKLVVRYKDKNGVKDLQKSIHYIEKLIEIEKAKLKDQ